MTPRQEKAKAKRRVEELMCFCKGLHPVQTLMFISNAWAAIDKLTDSPADRRRKMKLTTQCLIAQDRGW